MCVETQGRDRETRVRFTRRFALSAFQTLEEISIPFSCCINDIEATADHLENLERILFYEADLDDIIIFIKKSRKLTKIKVTSFVLPGSIMKKTDQKLIFDGCDHAGDLKTVNVINLPMLNAERAKLPNAKMVTLYVTEEVYLATKWTMKRTDFEFIQMRRNDSFEWDHDFYPI